MSATNPATPSVPFGRKRFALRLTLAQRLFVLALISLLPTTLMLVYNEIDFRRARLEEVHAGAVRNAQLAASEVEQIIDGVRAVVTTIAAAPVLRSTDTAACNDFLAKVIATVPQVAAVTVTDAKGDSRCRSNRLPTPLNLAGLPGFREAIESGKFALGEYVTGVVSGGPRLPAVLPIVNDAGAVEGAVVAAVNLVWLAQRVRDRGIETGNVIAITDRDGVFIVREPNPERFVGTRLNEEYRYLLTAPAPGSLELVNAEGKRRVAGYVPATASPFGIYVGVSTDSDDAFQTIERSTRRSLAFLAAGSIATLILAWWFGHAYIAHKVMRVVQTAETWRNGDMSVRTRMDGRDGEIETVAQAFDLLADQLAVKEREREKVDRQREILLHELNHRARNVLATVQSIASLSFRHAQGPEAFRAFNARLQALARSHELLTRKQWEAADIGEVVRDAIAPLRGDDDRRFSVGGPRVLLSSAATVSVSMMLHELATNAVKYGALSNDSGRVSISWTAEERRDEVDFRLQWLEYGGPPVVAPERSGFGSRLLPALAQEMNGDVQTSYLTEGVSCTMRLRLPRLAARS
ncbi:MAG: HAMP domain-containing protein [Alphaproteobacteria bacterium]|nr:HAMP domain-containing protein [Alphaproteobacteria bacterium]